ncbi:Hypothetical protein PENO1_022970 [Penicillium occitanis (nom. inval.)]|nr:hypothetical protein PENOC_040340 [Penicillium occitanis (nom. inval.)]PCH05302.1 Hypothetical protein PENO1_022970 [Penicillium occitanis (nom. inval.)]
MSVEVGTILLGVQMGRLWIRALARHAQIDVYNDSIDIGIDVSHFQNNIHNINDNVNIVSTNINNISTIINNRIGNLTYIGDFSRRNKGP